MGSLLPGNNNNYMNAKTLNETAVGLMVTPVVLLVPLLLLEQVTRSIHLPSDIFWLMCVLAYLSWILVKTELE